MTFCIVLKSFIRTARFDWSGGGSHIIIIFLMQKTTSMHAAIVLEDRIKALPEYDLNMMLQLKPSQAMCILVGFFLD